MVGSFLSLFAAGDCTPTNFLGLKPWYYYLNLNSSCQFDNNHTFQFLGSNSDFLLILLAIIDDLLMIAGLAAVSFVIYAGVKYITSQGSPDETSKALTTLISALVGLAIALVAIPTVSYLGNHYATGNATNLTVSSGASLNLNSLPNPVGVNNGLIVQTVLQDVFGVIGGVSFIFIIIGGYRYVLSSGDPQNTARAKDTILYALVGLIVAIVAESIVSLIIGKL
jgi:hypothetical protein